MRNRCRSGARLALTAEIERELNEYELYETCDGYRCSFCNPQTREDYEKLYAEVVRMDPVNGLLFQRPKTYRTRRSEDDPDVKIIDRPLLASVGQLTGWRAAP